MLKNEKEQAAVKFSKRKISLSSKRMFLKEAIIAGR